MYVLAFLVKHWLNALISLKKNGFRVVLKP
mgnify:FL=1